MKKAVILLIIVGMGCISQVEEKPELRITISADHFTQREPILLAVTIENIGKITLTDITLRIELPGKVTCNMTEYTIDALEPGTSRVVPFEIQPTAKGEHMLTVRIESDEVTVEREFALYEPYEAKDNALEKQEELEYIYRIFGAQYDTDDLYKADVDTLMLQLKEAGVNTVIFRVFDYEYEPLSDCGVYFQTDHAPVKRDVLKEVVEKAHKENIQVFAWMTTLDCPWVLADHPEWGVVAYDWETGDYITNASWWLRVSPFNKQHVEYLKQLYADLAQYDIEGIVFQDDLYLADNEDFSSYAAAVYSQEFGKVLSIQNMYDDSGALTEEGSQWVDWKCKILMDMCQEIINTVHNTNPDCNFLIDLYYEGVYRPDVCRKWYAQDARLAIQSGFDYLYVMSYHHFIAGEQGVSVEEAIDLLAELTETGITLVGEENLIMKVQVYDWFTSSPVEEWEIEKAYTALIEAGCIHIAYTPHHDQIPFALVNQFASQNGHSFCCI